MRSTGFTVGGEGSREPSGLCRASAEQEQVLVVSEADLTRSRHV